MTLTLCDLDLVTDLERRDDVVCVALGEVGDFLLIVLDKLEADGEPAPGHGRGVVIDDRLVVLQVVLHDVSAHVPVERISQHDRVRLLVGDVDPV